MTDLSQIIGMLQAQRRALLEQLGAIDRAIAALDSPAASAGDAAAAPGAEGNLTTGAVLPQRVTSRRTLSDEHKQAIAVGKRKARNAKEAAKGLAREAPDDSFVPAIRGRGDHQPPRLVKGPARP